jgi:hypothetical protein
VYRFNTPPGWPPPAEGWTPPPGWEPDRGWPPAPADWQFWVRSDPPDEPWAYPAAPARRSQGWVWPVLAVALLLVVGAGVIVTTSVIGRVGGGLTRADAQRECRTAFENEFTKREAALDRFGTDSIVSSLTGVDLTDTWEDGKGISVNGVVRYDLTTTLVPTIHSTIPLTCRAVTEGDEIRTTVLNRG